MNLPRNEAGQQASSLPNHDDVCHCNGLRVQQNPGVAAVDSVTALSLFALQALARILHSADAAQDT